LGAERRIIPGGLKCAEMELCSGSSLRNIVIILDLYRYTGKELLIPMIHYTDSSSSSEMIMMVKINLGLDIQSNFLNGGMVNMR
jgi:hypothetical protein